MAQFFWQKAFKYNSSDLPWFNLCFHRQDIRSSFEIDVEVYSLVGTSHIWPKTLVFISSKGNIPSQTVLFTFFHIKLVHNKVLLCMCISLFYSPVLRVIPAVWMLSSSAAQQSQGYVHFPTYWESRVFYYFYHYTAATEMFVFLGDSQEDSPQHHGMHLLSLFHETWAKQISVFSVIVIMFIKSFFLNSRNSIQSYNLHKNTFTHNSENNSAYVSWMRTNVSF